jgi:hypothetical protein
MKISITRDQLRSAIEEASGIVVDARRGPGRAARSARLCQGACLPHRHRGLDGHGTSRGDGGSQMSAQPPDYLHHRLRSDVDR